MRLYTLITCLATALIVGGCYVEEEIPGPRGPVGPQGPEGPPGSQTIALMYEIVFDLNANNDWQAFFEFPIEDEIFAEDVVLVYLLWEQEEVEGGELLDVWRLMPVNFFTDAGLLQINYDFTVSDVRLFADAAFQLDPNRDVYAGEIARIVVVPADFSPNARIDINYEDYYEVQEIFGLPEQTRRRGTPFLQSVRSGS